MPVLSPYGSHQAVMGYGTISIMGATPAALVGRSGNDAVWYSASKIVYQDYTAGAVLKTYDTGTLALATVDASGATTVGGGASVWAAFSAGSGVRTSVGGLGPFPLGGVSSPDAGSTLVSETGQTLFITSYGTSSGVSCYSALGVQQLNITAALVNSAVNIRQNIVSYQEADGWHLVNALTGGAVPGFLQRPNITKCIPFTCGSTVGVLEYQSGTDLLTVRAITSLTGRTIPTVGTEFHVDVQGVDASHVRVAYSLTAGEAAADLVILDINTVTGTTQEGTVVMGAVVFADGPTLPGASFGGSKAGSIVLPVQSQVVLDKATGQMNRVWRDALQNLAGGISTTQTQINNLPVPSVPPDGFGNINGIPAAQPDDTLTFTSADGSVDIVTDTAAKTIDLSVVTAGSQWIPLVNGAEPPVLVSDGNGALTLVAYS